MLWLVLPRNDFKFYVILNNLKVDSHLWVEVTFGLQGSRAVISSSMPGLLGVKGMDKFQGS